jgi:hypothetical protein
MSSRATKKPKSKRVLRGPLRRWHYTVEVYLPDIIASGVILPATARISAGERPAVWTSTNPVWEETANKGYFERTTATVHPATKATTLRFGGLARIEVRPEAAPYDWIAFRAISRIQPSTAAMLAKVGFARGVSPYDWFVSFDPIDAADWLAVEVWRDGQWVPAPAAAGGAAGRAS